MLVVTIVFKHEQELTATVPMAETPAAAAPSTG